MSKLSTALRSLGIGASAGLRSMTAPAAAFSLREGKLALPLVLLAAGELVVDKLPMTPSRLEPAPLAFRLVSGGVCGWIVAQAFGANRPAGLALGALGAAGAAYGGYYLRRGIVAETPLPDFVVALAEDAVAIGLAAGVTRKVPAEESN